MVRLNLFSFSVAGEAKRWLHSFKGNNLRTWEEVVEKFLKKYFPESKTAEGKMEISSFHHFPDESLSEVLDYFHRLLRKTPTHGYSEPLGAHHARCNFSTKQATDQTDRSLHRNPQQVASTITSGKFFPLFYYAGRRMPHMWRDT